MALVACSDMRSRLVCGFASVTGGRFVFTPGGGSGTCWHRNCSRTNRPRAVGEESSGFAVSARNKPCPRIPARSEFAGNGTRSKSLAGAGHAIDPRQFRADVAVIGREQVMKLPSFQTRSETNVRASVVMALAVSRVK